MDARIIQILNTNKNTTHEIGCIEILPFTPKYQTTFNCLTLIGAGLSILVSYALILVLRSKKSNYSRIMRHVLMSESIFIFAEMMIVTAAHYNFIYNGLWWILDFLTFYSIKFNSLTPEAIEHRRFQIMHVANLLAYYSNQAFSIILNIFICFEVILILKNPISQLKSRLKYYFLISTLTGIFVFILIIWDFRCYEDMSYSLGNLFITKSAIIVNFIVYILFLIIGFISMYYMFKRFCSGKSLVVSQKNFFVWRHFLYVICYSMCLLPIKWFEFLTIISPDGFNNADKGFLEVGIIINIFMGFIMFLLRVSETNFYSMIFCRKKNQNRLFNDSNISDKNHSSSNLEDADENQNFFDNDEPLTAIISKNMNLELMCCIMYGLTEIYLRPDRAQRSHVDNNQNITNFVNVTINRTNTTLQDLDNNNAFPDVEYTRYRTEAIHYKRIFDTSINFEEMNVEVRPENNSHDITANNENNEFGIKLIDEINNPNRPLADHDARIYEYCPRIFKELRNLDEITGEELAEALDPVKNRENMNEVREGQGKSGSFFFFSHNNKFIIKTITNNELDAMLGKFMKRYHSHLKENDQSLLGKIYGIYSIEIKNVSKINIILMQNLITVKKRSNGDGVFHINKIFDLKGSLVGRKTENAANAPPMKALKDSDYLSMTITNYDLVDFEPDKCSHISDNLEKDLKMLREIGVMDYSLLLIIMNFPEQTDCDYQRIIEMLGDMRLKSKIFKSKNQKYIYILGIIDYLQKFNIIKFFEIKLKSVAYGSDIKYVSAAHPKIYAERMLNFIKKNVLRIN